MKKVSIIGAGSWGCALGLNLIKNNYEVTMWSLSEDQVNEINIERTNKKYLPGIHMPKSMTATNSIEDVLMDSEIVVLAVPSQAIRSICEAIKPYINEKHILVDVAKGLEKGTALKMSEICEEVLPNTPYCVLSGPSHAEEVAKDIPTAVTVASNNLDVAKKVQVAFSNETFRVYVSNDVVGVELGGAFKNIIAFGAGICDGVEYGDNTKAALMTRGLIEIARLGEALGADTKSFNGLSGIGDLIVTCTSMHSRNRRAGILIGQGKSLQETLDEVQMVVEGITATEVAYKLAKELNIETPIIDSIYSVLYLNNNADDAIRDLMTREYKEEIIAL